MKHEIWGRNHLLFSKGIQNNHDFYYNLNTLSNDTVPFPQTKTKHHRCEGWNLSMRWHESPIVRLTKLRISHQKVLSYHAHAAS